MNKIRLMIDVTVGNYKTTVPNLLNVPYTLALKDDIMANYEERLKEYSDEATGFYY